MSTSYYVTPKKECRTCEHRNKLPIDRLQSQIDVFVEKGQKPPSELISEINAAKKELRQKPLTITGIKAKVLAQPEAVEVAPELEPLAKEARRSRRTNRAASQSNR